MLSHRTTEKSLCFRFPGYLLYCCLLWIVVILFSFQTSIASDTPINLTWDPSTSEDVAGYTVHHGTATRTYTDHVDMGDATSYEITGLQAGISYYFAVYFD